MSNVDVSAAAVPVRSAAADCSSSGALDTGVLGCGLSVVGGDEFEPQVHREGRGFEGEMREYDKQQQQQQQGDQQMHQQQQQRHINQQNDPRTPGPSHHDDKTALPPIIHAIMPVISTASGLQVTWPTIFSLSLLNHIFLKPN
jgi:hypothetical protein